VAALGGIAGYHRIGRTFRVCALGKVVTLKAPADWWKTMFDEVYLMTDARSVCDEDITRREVDLICRLIPMRFGDRILDLCGGHGRHSIEFCTRGFGKCTVVDYSACLIDCAKTKAAECHYTINCIQADARETGLPAESFDHVLIMGNSLGYIPGAVADKEIITEALRVLRSGGWLLVDVTDGEKVKSAFSPRAWHEIGGDVVVCRERSLDGNILSAREIVLSKREGLIRDCKYAIRLYDVFSLKNLVASAGFRDVTVHTDFSPHRRHGDFGFMNCRMLASGQKP
jgi:D-alanine-D-alanine ligase